jgi:hypothetical protein
VTGKRTCEERSIRLDAIEPLIWEDVIETLSKRAKLAALVNAQFAEAAARETDHAAERLELTDQIERLRRREFRCRQAMLDSDLADSFAAFKDDLRNAIQQRQGLERRLESIAPTQQPVGPESFSEFCRRMEKARDITDRGQQRDFLRACVERIDITREHVNTQFSLNLPAAIAAIGLPDGPADPGAGGNCQSGEF